MRRTIPELSERNGAAHELADDAAALKIPAASTVRTIYSSAWEERQGEAGGMLVYRVRGNGFLHHMVRNLVGTMLDVGRGHLALEEISGDSCGAKSLGSRAHGAGAGIVFALGGIRLAGSLTK